jgi:hypothetical protein
MKLLRGFAPFQAFVTAQEKGPRPIEDQSGGGFVAIPEAMEALELGGASALSSSTQESVASAGSCSTAFSPEENKGKIAHFLQVVHHMVNASLHPTLVRDKRGAYTVVEPSMRSTSPSERVASFSAREEPSSMVSRPSTENNHSLSTNGIQAETKASIKASNNDDMDMHDEKYIDDDLTMEANDEEEHNDVDMQGTGTGDVLEYRVPEGGQGPALLVPGALLLNLVNDSTEGVPPSRETAERAPEPMNMGAPVALSNHFNQLPLPNVTEGVTPLNSTLPLAPPPPSPHRVMHSVDMDVGDDPAPMVPELPVALSPPRPPPGFGGMANHASMIPTASHAMPPMASHPSNSFSLHPHVVMGVAVHPPPSYQGEYVQRTVGESFPFFGFPPQQPPSLNPFFTTVPVGFPQAHGGGGMSFPGPSYGSSNHFMSGHFLDSEATASSDGASLLDSSLLSSLWMEESHNNNNNNSSSNNNNNNMSSNHHLTTNKQQNPFTAT